jgi:hypothetical protein
MSGVGDGREVELWPRVAGESATIKMSTTVGKIKRVRTVAPSASDFAALVEMYGSTPATDEPSIRETSPGRLSENGILGGESDREGGRKVAVNTNLMVRRSYSSGMLEEGWPLEIVV